MLQKCNWTVHHNALCFVQEQLSHRQTTVHRNALHFVQDLVEKVSILHCVALTDDGSPPCFVFCSGTGGEGDDPA